MNANITDDISATAAKGAARRGRGFTLAELVVTVAIVGILASASYGSYQNYLKRSNRSAAQQFMLEVMNRQELYLLDARVYTDAVGDTGLGLTIPAKVAQHYAITIALTAGPPPGYVITATPGGNQATDGVLTLSSAGEKLPLQKWEQ
ncbi:MAG: type IV pilin protein [Betaproteobacteria bacterium]|nr:MAG: type IV pilin protein [Betaproteobacteria bacterium]